MSINNRLLLIVQHYNITVVEMARLTGVKQGTLNNIINHGAIPRADTISLILDHYTDINARWLLTGKGEMWDTPQLAKEPIKPINNDYILSEMLNELRQIRKNTSPQTE